MLVWFLPLRFQNLRDAIIKSKSETRFLPVPASKALLRLLSVGFENKHPVPQAISSNYSKPRVTRDEKSARNDQIKSSKSTPWPNKNKSLNTSQGSATPVIIPAVGT